MYIMQENFENDFYQDVITRCDALVFSSCNTNILKLTKSCKSISHTLNTVYMKKDHQNICHTSDTRCTLSWAVIYFVLPHHTNFKMHH